MNYSFLLLKKIVIIHLHTRLLGHFLVFSLLSQVSDSALLVGYVA